MSASAWSTHGKPIELSPAERRDQSPGAPVRRALGGGSRSDDPGCTRWKEPLVAIQPGRPRPRLESAAVRRRHPDPEVVVLVRPPEATPTDVLLVAARTAHDQGVPLDVVVVGGFADSRAQRLVAADQALHRVRVHYPRLELRVHEDVADVDSWLRRHRLDLRQLWASPLTPVLDELGLLPIEHWGPWDRCHQTADVAVGTAVIRTSAIDAVLFDLDGVLTDTAILHREAWGRLVAEHLGDPELTDAEYVELVDGRRRDDGVVALMTARGRTAEPAAVSRLAAVKDRYFLDLLGERGAVLVPGSVDLLHRLRRARVRCGVVTASRNCTKILDAAGLAGLFDTQVDGLVVASLGLAGKPEPASYLEAARRLGAVPARSVVVEDSRAGVEAGRRGGFGLVIGLDRRGGRGRLREHGADVTVDNLLRVDVIEDA